MSSVSKMPLHQATAQAALPLTGAHSDYDALLQLVGNARFVLLGEASHGTHEFYRERARITERLIAEKGFTAVAVEADWPDALRVNRYVRGQGGDISSEQALSGFRRFPTWMWRNTDVVHFVDWLRRHNSARRPADAAGFYGLDLYSMFTSIGEVLQYLDKVDPAAASRARQRYACFDHYGEDSQRYGYAAGFALSASCEDAAVAQLREMQARSASAMLGKSAQAAEAAFHARENARLVMNAEQYYRTMFRGRISSWNLRDRHMSDTLDALTRHLTEAYAKPAKIVVWEHNSHIGDARATEVGEQGEWTVGQLVRERYGKQARLIGFTTYEGTVTAASEWNGVAECKRVRPALAGSYEEIFHQAGIARFMLDLREGQGASEALEEARLERAIGVIYLPQTERCSHYFHASLPRQFDAVLHFDRSSAVEPLERGSQWRKGEVPETFPSGV
jgi:erythromycin esterase-like protein